MVTTAGDDYFRWSRREIEPLLPAAARRVLEIGCSSGATLAWLRDRWPEAETVGVDGHAPVKPILSANATRAVIHDLEEPLPELGWFDLILALDVLEHLRHPVDVLAGLVGRLEPGGTVIVSVPNIAHHSIVRDLLFRRRFEYRDDGIMDRTHLRWFTEASAVGMMNRAGLAVSRGVVNGLAGRKTRLLDRATLGAFRHYLVKQYIMAGTPGGDQGRVAWGRSRTRAGRA